MTPPVEPDVISAETIGAEITRRRLAGALTVSTMTVAELAALDCMLSLRATMAAIEHAATMAAQLAAGGVGGLIRPRK